MDDREACSSSGNDQRRLASIAGAFLSDNIRSAVKPLRKLIGRSKASQSRSVLHPLRQSLADGSASEAHSDLYDRLDSSISARDADPTLLKHRLKPQVTLLSRSYNRLSWVSYLHNTCAYLHYSFEV